VVPPVSPGGVVPPVSPGGVVPPVSPGGVVPPVSPGGVVPPVSPAGTVSPVGPTSPTSPTAPTPPKTPTMVLDVLASTNGQFEVAVDAPSAGAVNPVAFTTGNSAMNQIDISGQAQSNLSAMVNVNAAGSVVPVMLNLTVIMGSNYGQVSNFNGLDLNSYAVFQVK